MKACIQLMPTPQVELIKLIKAETKMNKKIFSLNLLSVSQS
jgi:hypothetical protein